MHTRPTSAMLKKILKCGGNSIKITSNPWKKPFILTVNESWSKIACTVSKSQCFVKPEDLLAETVSAVIS